MKKIIPVLSLLFLFSCSSKKGESFTVEGTVKNTDAHTIYLEEVSQSRPVVVDSARVGKDGNFSLQTAVNEESLYNLRADNQPIPFAVVVNDSKKLRVTADFSNKSEPYTVSGSEASQHIIDFDKKLTMQGRAMSQAANEYDSLSRINVTDSNGRRVNDSLKAANYEAYQAAAKEMKDYTANLIDKSSSPSLVIYAYGLLDQMFRQFNMRSFDRTETAAIVNKAAQRFPNHPAILEWKKRAGSIKAPDFSLPDTSGKPVSLSSFKGKYVLVDFWASWCQPCRMENPNVVAAYNQFRNKNFTILGVSLDQNKASWVKAIHDDGLDWNHVSDLKYWNSEAANLYGVNSIPFNVLVDPEGNIIAEDIRGPELMAKLSEVLK